MQHCWDGMILKAIDKYKSTDANDGIAQARSEINQQKPTMVAGLNEKIDNMSKSGLVTFDDRSWFREECSTTLSDQRG
ncbi:hypothetical protein O0I10_003071 [Lichtheimia ornata]|uniref:Uncharacterized protein n=1 Tax=Lichtheimia ornata TaxID=688661 RepID=A0AAD7VA97_9FUNG|nr:uncharacterized protein O0I10_003071 [Lichtheimia ornata]KAJ8661321.1 hypothetical protein O0I10_003071 [Lichtheimia ornata]